MSEKGRHGVIATQGRGIHLDEWPLELMARFLEFEDFDARAGLARPSRAGEQDGCLGSNCNLLDTIDHSVERSIAGFDT